MSNIPQDYNESIINSLLTRAKNLQNDNNLQEEENFIENSNSVFHDERDDAFPSELDYNDFEDTQKFLINLGLQFNHYKSVTHDEHVNLAKKIEAGVFALERLKDYKNIKSIEILEKIISIGKDSFNKMVLHNLGLVGYWVRKIQYRYPMIDAEDAFQSGIFGLIQSIKMWDFKLGYKFSTYASNWIKQYIYREFFNTSNLIRLPVHIYESIRYSRENTCWEINIDGKLTKEEFSTILNCLNIDSLDVEIGEFFDPQEKNINLILEDTFLRDYINIAIDSFTKKEQGIIRMRFGLSDGEVRSLDFIGKIYGVTRERIRQIETKVLETMRGHDAIQGLRGYCD